MIAIQINGPFSIVLSQDRPERSSDELLIEEYIALGRDQAIEAIQRHQRDQQLLIAALAFCLGLNGKP
jgi:hypothetical protein